MKVEQGPRPGEIVFSVCLLAFSGWALWQSYAISGLESLFGPGVFPMLASAVMVLSGLSILGRTLKERRGQSDNPSSVFAYLFPIRLIVFAPMMVAFAAAMPWIGFFPSAALFILASIAFLWRRNLIWTLAITALSVVAIYVIFRLVFQVVLPSGVLWS
ncbi:MAG: tripartite tricarboxylate transporter TctB family protein [Pseudomonadota bacterium]